MPTTDRATAALWMRTTAFASLCAVALSACGTTDVGEQDDSDAADSGPITVTDYSGEEITLDAPAQRVVTLEWTQTENVEMLGGNHVGAADIENFSVWNSAVELDEDLTDVGMRTEPSLEAIAQADPDLILGVDVSVSDDSVLEDLQEIAPVVLQPGADASDPVGNMRDNFYQTAELLGAEDTADEVWADYEAAVEEAAGQISESGAEDTPFVTVYPTVEGNTATFRMHGPGALAQTLGEEIGLVPAWEESGDEQWGISDSDVEGLDALPEETMFYWWTYEGAPEDPFEPLENNSAWTSLGFVENDAMAPVDRIWIYGGPGSAIQWVEYLAETAGQ